MDVFVENLISLGNLESVENLRNLGSVGIKH